MICLCLLTDFFSCIVTIIILEQLSTLWIFVFCYKLSRFYLTGFDTDFGHKSPALFPSSATKVNRAYTQWKSRRGTWVCSGGTCTKGRRKCNISYPIFPWRLIIFWLIALWIHSSIPLSCINSVSSIYFSDHILCYYCRNPMNFVLCFLENTCHITLPNLWKLHHNMHVSRVACII